MDTYICLSGLQARELAHSSSLSIWEEPVDTSMRRAKNLASREYAPGPMKAYEEAESKTIASSTGLLAWRCGRSSSTAIVSDAQTAGVNRPAQSMPSKMKKATCCHPVGNAMPASATAMQLLNTSRAAPGAPAGNIE